MLHFCTFHPVLPRDTELTARQVPIPEIPSQSPIVISPCGHPQHAILTSLELVTAHPQGWHLVLGTPEGALQTIVTHEYQPILITSIHRHS